MMMVDPERRRAELIASNYGDGVLFKLRRELRVAPVGRATARRYRDLARNWERSGSGEQFFVYVKLGAQWDCSQLPAARDYHAG